MTERRIDVERLAEATWNVNKRDWEEKGGEWPKSFAGEPNQSIWRTEAEAIAAEYAQLAPLLTPAAQGSHLPATPDDPADGAVGGILCPDCEHPQSLHTTGGICHGSPEGCYCVRIPPMEPATPPSKKVTG